MSIEVRVPGSPTSVRAVADWLDDVKARFSDVDLELSYIWSDSNTYWTGEAGHAWRQAVGSVRERAMGLVGFLGDAVDTFRAYANRLERTQDDFATLRFQAREVGLSVIGVTVFPPTTTLDYCPAPGAPAEDISAYDDYIDKLASYNDLGAQMGTMIGELDAWVGENIIPLVARVEGLRDLAGTVEALLAKGNEEIAPGVLSGYDEFMDHQLAEWRTDHNAMQEAAETFHDQLRSGNPAVRAAAEAADPDAMRHGAAQLAEHIGNVSKWTRVIPVAGTVFDIVSIASEVESGGSLTSELAELGGGVVGGAAVGATASGPVGWVVTGVVVGGVAAGWGARWLWEATVPLDVRESIDDFFVGGAPRLEGYSPPPPRSRPAPTEDAYS